MKFLLIEDDHEIVETINLLLEMRWNGANLVSTMSGQKGIELARTESPDAIILDLGLPDIDGFQVLEQVRGFSDVPLLILTVRGEEMMKVRGLEAGADDYVTKPFSPVELLARLRAMTRRTQAPEKTSDYHTKPFIRGKLRVDFSSGELSIEGKPVKINPREYDLLQLFVTNPGVEFTNEELLEKVFDQDENRDLDYLKYIIKSLKDKMELKSGNPEMIIAVGDRGYKFVSP
ncbi:response regulator transcription factor [Chloroflexota bacterium]